MSTQESLSSASDSRSFYDRFNSPEAQIVLRHHFAQQVFGGIHLTYARALDGYSIVDDDYEEPEASVIRERIRNAEFPLVVVADKDSVTGEIVDLSLHRIDLSTGKAMESSSVSVVGHVGSGGEILEVYDPWSHAQGELIQRMGDEQSSVGLDPRYLYSALWKGWAE